MNEPYILNDHDIVLIFDEPVDTKDGFAHFIAKIKARLSQMCSDSLRHVLDWLVDHYDDYYIAEDCIGEKMMYIEF